MKKTIKTAARPEHEILGKLLHQLRVKKGLTQDELGKKLDRNHSYIWKLETGYQHIDIATLIDICCLTDGDPAELIRTVQEQAPPSRFCKPGNQE